MADKKKVIIVDDVELNRAILREAFCKEYDVLEAEDGSQGLTQILENKDSLAAIFLDIIMPEMDGFTVLQELDYNHIMEKIPLFLITTETTDYVVEKAYNYGAVDVIQKPFNLVIIERRVKNIIDYFETKKSLEKTLEQKNETIQIQGAKLQENTWNIISALASAIENRSEETGEHTDRVAAITELIAKKISERHPEYSLDNDTIKAISMASVLHDCGKINISDKILNKPASAGRLTKDEFEVMKTHTTVGYNYIKSIKGLTEPLYTFAKEICHSHHERWDGSGYPEGLKGNQIPLSAQIVSIADCYDALMSPRVYKPAFSNSTSIEMINNGECGSFNPVVLECFNDITDEIYIKYYKNRA